MTLLLPDGLSMVRIVVVYNVWKRWQSNGILNLLCNQAQAAEGSGIEPQHRRTHCFGCLVVRSQIVVVGQFRENVIRDADLTLCVIERVRLVIQAGVRAATICTTSSRRFVEKIRRRFVFRIGLQQLQAHLRPGVLVEQVDR